MLLVSTTRLNHNTQFDDVVSSYVTVLNDTEGLVAEYVEVDSEECHSRFGVKVSNPGSWQEVRGALGQISSLTGANYFILLGGMSVVPRPYTDVPATSGTLQGESGTAELILSDAWYVDFDEDLIVDEGYAVSRLAGLDYGSIAIRNGLQTAIDLHLAGGFTLDRYLRFSSLDYTTPPYGVCGACTEKSAFFNLVTTSDYIVFTGRGTPAGFYNNDLEPILTIDYMSDLDLQTRKMILLR